MVAKAKQDKLAQRETIARSMQVTPRGGHHFGRIPAFFFACCPLPFAPRTSCICLNFFFA